MNQPALNNKPIQSTPFWRWLTGRSIRAKLKLIIMTVSSIGIISAGITLLIIQRSDIRHNMVSDLTALTEIIAENSKSALSFQDKVDAREILSSLTRKKSITLSILYDADKNIYASSPASYETDTSQENILEQFLIYRFTDEYLEIQRPVFLDQRRIGTVFIRSNLDSLNEAMNRLIYSLLVTLVLLELVAYFLASYMQRVISRPLIFLAHLARRISNEKDYSLRAIKQTDDELGELTDDFNNMLTQVERREKELKESEQRFQFLIEQAVDAIYLFDLEGKILQVNPSASQSLGYSQAQLLTMSMYEIDKNLPTKDNFPDLWERLEIGQSRTVSSDFTKIDGKTVPVEIHFGRINLDNQSLILAFARDITQRKLAEAALKQSHDDLEIMVNKRTEQLSQINRELIKEKENAEAASRAKSEFLANMSHEIRTPMNAVMGFTDLLKDSPLEKKQNSYVASIQAGARGLMTIINDVLDLSKIEAGKLSLEYEAIDTYSFIFDIEKIFSQAIEEKGLDFEIIVEKELPKALVIDQTRVRQILFNLIGNAIKFTENGFVRVYVKHVQQSADDTSNGNEHSKVDISFSIEDSGIGIDANQLEKVFEQFVQHKGQSTAKFGGTGLGLTICRNLAEMMNGEISVNSEVGKGSKFTLQLNDIAVASITDRSNEFEEGKLVVFEPARILIVDDIEPNRTLVIEQLGHTKLSFLEAENGQQALDMVQQYKPDLIIMDIRMPVMDGIEATRRLKNNPDTKNIPVIALTASVSKTDTNALIHSDFDKLLHKPVRKMEVINALQKFLNYENQVSNTHTKSQEDICEQCSSSQLVELISQLKVIEHDSYHSASSSGMMSSIETFAKMLVTSNELKSNSAIVAYSQSIKDAASLFDIEKIENMLPKFPDLIADFERQLALKDQQDA